MNLVFVGASIARPLKNGTILGLQEQVCVSPHGDGFCIGKIRGRPMVAPTTHLWAFYLIFSSAQLSSTRKPISPSSGAAKSLMLVQSKAGQSRASGSSRRSMHSRC